MTIRRGSLVKSGLSAAAVTGLGLGFLSTLGAGAAFASPITASIDYSCKYPLVGARDLQVNISTDIPKQVTVHTPTPAIYVDTDNIISADTVEGLHAIGAATLEGNATAKISVSNPDTPQPLDVAAPQTLEKIDVTKDGSAHIRSNGAVIPLTFKNPGHVVITIGELDLQVTPKKADGSPTGMGTFNVVCTQTKSPTTVLAEADVVTQTVVNPPVTPPPVNYPVGDGTTYPVTKLHYDLNLNGSSFIKGANGTLPIIGKIGVDVDGASGAITGPLTLNPAKGSFNILGFLPVTSSISFTQTEQTTGAYANGVIDTTSKMNVNYADFSAFGVIPIAGGQTCATSSPISVAMHSDRSVLFNPYKGGSFNADNYTLPPLNNNCGGLGGIVSIFEQGSGNTITAKLTPQ